MVVDKAAELSASAEVRYAALCHDLGKGLTPADMLPRHRGHEERGVDLIADICERFRVPKRFCELARITARYHGQVHRAAELRPQTMLALFEGVDLFRRPQRLEQMLIACEADFRGRTGFEELPYPQGDLVRRCARATQGLDVRTIAAAAAEPSRIPEDIRRARLTAIRGVLRRPDAP
jgi:tRNA nucleotidyltransferase (CCA-adding enzyme)